MAGLFGLTIEVRQRDMALRAEDRRRLGKAKKTAFLFCFSLALHYLCHCIAKIGFGSGMQTKNFVFCLVFRSPCTTFAIV